MIAASLLRTSLEDRYWSNSHDPWFYCLNHWRAGLDQEQLSINNCFWSKNRQKTKLSSWKSMLLARNVSLGGRGMMGWWIQFHDFQFNCGGSTPHTLRSYTGSRAKSFTVHCLGPQKSSGVFRPTYIQNCGLNTPFKYLKMILCVKWASHNEQSSGA